MDLLPEGENILESCNNEFWRAANGKAGEEAEMIVDLKCTTQIESFSIINGFGDFGTKKYTLFGSENLEGPWTEIHSGELPQGLEMTDEVKLSRQFLSMSNIMIVGY